ncbi:MAG: FAD-binding protein, partial [Clostridiales bacterium]|nr:FAD-binding protein [Clostridiales bacterium]
PQVHGLNERRIEELVYEASRHGIKFVPCPVRHMGTDKAFDVLKAMYEHLMGRGVEFKELTAVEDILVSEGRAVGVRTRHRNGEVMEYSANHVVVAPGRGGAQWLTSQAAKLGTATKNNAVDIGVRVEVPNSVMDHLTRDLYEAKLIYYSDTFENKARTFCMNPGGIVSEEHYEEGLVVVNGHSYSDPRLRTGNTNFALLVSTTFTEPFNQPIEYGKYIAKLANMLTGGGIMVQRLGDLLKGRRTSPDRLKKSTTVPTLKSAVPGDLSFVLPDRHLTSIVEALRAFDKLTPNLYSRNTLLYGCEVKFYSSKVEVDSRFRTKIENLYAIGDGAGITRGLMQASVTGIIVAREIANITG